jgi:hypothetical protein
MDDFTVVLTALATKVDIILPNIIRYNFV